MSDDPAVRVVNPPAQEGDAKIFYRAVFTVAAETIRKGAPGLSQATAEAIARGIALKVQADPAARALNPTSKE